MYAIIKLAVPFASPLINVNNKFDTCLITNYVVYIYAWNFFICNYRVDATQLFNLTQIQELYILLLATMNS